jgi:hypothetical protein
MIPKKFNWERYLLLYLPHPVEVPGGELKQELKREGERELEEERES